MARKTAERIPYTELEAMLSEPEAFIVSLGYSPTSARRFRHEGVPVVVIKAAEYARTNTSSTVHLIVSRSSDLDKILPGLVRSYGSLILSNKV